MADIIHLARARTATQSHSDTTNPELIQLHAQAENALVTALHHLRSPDASPSSLSTATARAIRATTALKRLSAMNAEVAL